jgi:hypothetical protein
MPAKDFASGPGRSRLFYPVDPCRKLFKEHTSNSVPTGLQSLHSWRKQESRSVEIIPVCAYGQKWNSSRYSEYRTLEQCRGDAAIVLQRAP